MLRNEMPVYAPPRRIAILGGGLTALAAAIQLLKENHSVRIFEVEDRVGGSVRTDIEGGWLAERGPFAMVSHDFEFSQILRDSGADRERIDAAPIANRRYVVRRGRLRRAPRSAATSLTSSFVPAHAKLRGLLEFLRQPPMPDRAVDHSFAEFGRRHFGAFGANYLAQAFAAEAYAGDAAKLSAKHAFPAYWQMWSRHGSLLAARIKHVNQRIKEKWDVDDTLFSFRRGMQTLVHGLVMRLPSDVIVPCARVEALLPGSIWHVIYRNVRGMPNGAEVSWSDSDDAGRKVEACDLVISTLPAQALSKLAFGDRVTKPLADLGGLESARVATLFLGFHKDQVGHPLDAHSVISPPRERRSFLTATFASSLFPGRAPEGHVAISVAVGGTVRPDLASLPESQLLEAVMPDLRQLLRIKGDPVFVRCTHRSIPQYPVGYDRYHELMDAAEGAYPGFFIGGSPRGVVTVQNALDKGEWLGYWAHKWLAKQCGMSGPSWSLGPV